jgi:beta-aspartyl-peptidase (threonine type)
MGGHMYPGVTIPSDLDAYRWLVNASGAGGDWVVLTADAAPCDIYNPLLLNLTSGGINSVTTICFTSRAGALLPRTAQLLRAAAGVFVTGGDQFKYYSMWRGTPVATLLPRIPVMGGSSAGLAVQGRFVFDAAHGGVASEDALDWPLDEDISLVDDLFQFRWMGSVLTDTHFFQRDRMGRLVVFLARARANGWGAKSLTGVAVSEHSAMLVDGTTGRATFLGVGPIYVVTPPAAAPAVFERGDPLTYSNLRIAKWNSSLEGAADAVYDFAGGSWNRSGAASVMRYNISAVEGKLLSTQKGGGVY